jgi:hypothetical protein
MALIWCVKMWTEICQFYDTFRLNPTGHTSTAQLLTSLYVSGLWRKRLNYILLLFVSFRLCFMLVMLLFVRCAAVPAVDQTAVDSAR